MNILEKLMGNDYPKLESAIYADGSKTVVTVSRTLSPDWVNLDSPGYLENKLNKKLEPISVSIGVKTNEETKEQTINVTLEACGAFNSISHLNRLTKIAKCIGKIAECRLSEPEVINNISMDCKKFVCNESEEEKHEDA